MEHCSPNPQTQQNYDKTISQNKSWGHSTSQQETSDIKEKAEIRREKDCEDAMGRRRQ